MPRRTRHTPKRLAPVLQIGTVAHQLNARRDTLDFRDRMYEPTLANVPSMIPLASYRESQVPILNQGSSGACTGYALATVANYLLRNRVKRDQLPVSPWMLYEMARRYDDYPDDQQEGSTARGAMKGWQKHGVCKDSKWPSAAVPNRTLTYDRANDATARPLGAYMRVNHLDLVAVHAAIAEVGVLYATADVHSGWRTVKQDGIIDYQDGCIGTHAFAIVGYDVDGFWIQNSWGSTWGKQGYALISYADWLDHSTDVWVARLGVPVKLANVKGASVARSELAGAREVTSNHDLRPHIISLGDNGEPRNTGPFGTTPDDIDEILTEDFERITGNWPVKRILLYAHGGLVSEPSAIQHVADYRAQLLDVGVYPLAFIWKTDLWSTITDMIKDARARRRAEGIFEGAKDYVLDRMDDFLESVLRTLGARAFWSEMKKNADCASTLPNGGTALVAPHVARLARAGVEVHMAAHSAGSILLGSMVNRLASSVRIKSCTLWAPAITMKDFDTTYASALTSGKLKHLNLFTLQDQVEQDDNCADIYHKSLLYMVSDVFEETQRIPPDYNGEPLLGLERFSTLDARLQQWLQNGKLDWIHAPTGETALGNASQARHHGDFDDDPATLKSTLYRIVGDTAATVSLDSHVHSASNRRDLRKRSLA